MTKRSFRVRVELIDGQWWHVCPIRGADCYRVNDRISADMARDAVLYHVDLHHYPWQR